MYKAKAVRSSWEFGCHWIEFTFLFPTRNLSQDSWSQWPQ
uniref:Macaca fascicularis brain cDNA clone: QmoA-12501, similar to human chromosome 5 open reading frame 6 (C5orf6), mRNA, RefSeq: NM_016605.1 n=1 Tax=Macaca fascicularis TaxID=9541 RepID=I7GEE9_MACFA|nr:unnamed protein product [Macaca fascicularis]